MRIDGAEYRRQLVEFEPKMRAMVQNFIRTGYRFDGYEEDDLVHELHVKALEVEDYYDAEKSALRTLWYRCFAARLSQLAQRSARQALLWHIQADGDDGEPFDAAEEPGIEGRRRATLLVDRLLRELSQEDPALARTAAAVMDCDGDVEEAARALRQEPQRVRWALTRMRGMIAQEV